MSIFGKGSKLYAIFGMKCPRCHESDLFETGSFSFSKPFEMRKECPNCRQNFMPEPGFYYGAMFISYIWTAWFCILVVGGLHWGIGWSVESSFLVLIAFLALIFVWTFRVSRAIWINIVVRYEV